MKKTLVPIFAALALASRNRSPLSDDRICLSASQQVAQRDWKACIHKWAYRLAPSPEHAKVVAEATLEACAAAIEW